MRNKFILMLISIVAIGLLTCGVLAGSGRQELPDVELSAYRVQLENHLPPNEGQVKLLLEGDDAQPIGRGLILLVNSRVASFNTNGVLEMEARSPRCILDVVHRTVSSTGVLEIHTGDGASSVRGEGFLLSTNSTLTFSNRMTTVIRNIRMKTSRP